MSRSQIGQLPLLAHPQAAVSDKTHEQTMNAVARAYAETSLTAMTLPTGLASVPE